MWRLITAAALVLLPALLGGVCVGVQTDVLAASDDAQGAEADAFYAKCESDMAADAAGALWKVAESARKLHLNAYANDTARRVLAFDPDHKQARKRLGFVKRRGEWEVDQKAAHDIPRENERPKRMSSATFADRQRTWRDEALGQVLASIADAYADLGRRCAEKGYDVLARRARDEALRQDPDCAAARAALGFERVGETWMTSAQKHARDAASKPEAFEENSHLDDVLGTTLTKVRSANLVAESALGEELTSSLVSVLETTYTYYLTDAGHDPNESVFASPVHACFVESSAQWSSWLEDQIPDRAGFFRDLYFYRSSASMLLAVRENAEMGSGAPGLVEDNAVHAFTHLLNDVVWKLNRHAWLDEGLAYYYTLKVRGTTESWCVEHDVLSYADDGAATAENKVTENAWRQRVKELVRRRDDMDLRMLTARPLNELKLSETIKAWSVATWIIETDRPGALRFFTEISKARSGAAALESHFGRSVEATDAAWRAWVLETY